MKAEQVDNLAVLESADDGLLVVNCQGRIVRWTSRLAHLWDLTPDLLGARDLNRLVDRMAELVRDPIGFRSRWAAGQPEDATAEVELRDGRFFQQRSTSLRDPTGASVGRAWWFRDVTDLRRATHERDITVRLLGLLEACTTVRGLADRLCEFLREQFGVEAVAIRLLNDQDYPYAQTTGLSPDFVAAESSLCVLDGEGRCAQGADGRPTLACLCGRVIRGNEGLADPLLTPSGSFVTQSTTDFLTRVTADQLGPHVRGRCAREGFESLALIPLRAGGQCLGLLQLCDRRTGVFDPYWVGHLERLAGCIALTLARLRLQEENHRAEESLRHSTQALHAIVAASPLAIFDIDHDGRVRSIWNPAAERILGWSRAEILGQILPGFVQMSREDFAELRDRAFRGEQFTAEERKVHRKDGSLVHVSIAGSPLHTTEGRVLTALGIVEDITLRRRAEEDREDTIAFLQLVNANDSLHDVIEASVRFFRERSGCEAVGIRLHDGDDYPYYEVQGFPESFVRAENSLCSQCADGQIERDAAGNPVLACMCGNVIRGRFDPSKPFFSQVGSFWTNSTTALLASTTEADRQARTRNRCHGEGYESVALVPLRLGEERFGLLQINDRRKNMFTPEIIARWERLAGYLAMALAQARAQEALSASEQFVRATLDGLSDHIAIVDGNGVIVAVNAAWDAFAAANGPIRGNVGIGANYLDVCDRARGEDAASASAFAQGLRDVLAGRRDIFQMEYPCHSPGERRWFVARATRFPGEGPAHAVLAHQSITELKLAEEELRQSEHWLRQIVDSDMIGIVFAEAGTGVLLDANDAYLKTIGRTREEMRSAQISWRDITSPETLANDDRAIEGANAKGVSLHYEKEYIRPDGTRVPVLVRAAYADEDRKVAVGFVLDLTEQKKAEAALRTAAKLAATGQLAAGIAHEINNPLAGIQNSFLLIKDAIPPDHPHFGYVARIENEIARIARIIQRMYSLHKQAPLAAGVFDLCGVIQDVADLTRHGSGKKVTINVELPEKPRWVNLPEDAIRQVLLNVLRNAVDASPEGDAVTVSMRGTAPLRILVSDNGPGIPEHLRGRVFEPFFSTKQGTHGSGMGLGLSVCYSLMQAMGGRIDFQSQKDKGITFDIQLPGAVQ